MRDLSTKRIAHLFSKPVTAYILDHTQPPWLNEVADPDTTEHVLAQLGRVGYGAFVEVHQVGEETWLIVHEDQQRLLTPFPLEPIPYAVGDKVYSRGSKLYAPRLKCGEVTALFTNDYRGPEGLLHERVWVRWEGDKEPSKEWTRDLDLDLGGPRLRPFE